MSCVILCVLTHVNCMVFYMLCVSLCCVCSMYRQSVCNVCQLRTCAEGTECTICGVFPALYVKTLSDCNVCCVYVLYCVYT